MTPEAKDFLQLAKALKELGATEFTFGDYSVVFSPSDAAATPPVAKPGPVLVALPQPQPPIPLPIEPRTPQEVREAISKALLDE